MTRTETNCFTIKELIQIQIFTPFCDGTFFHEIIFFLIKFGVTSAQTKSEIEKLNKMHISKLICFEQIKKFSNIKTKINL